MKQPDWCFNYIAPGNREYRLVLDYKCDTTGKPHCTGASVYDKNMVYKGYWQADNMPLALLKDLNKELWFDWLNRFTTRRG